MTWRNEMTKKRPGLLPYTMMRPNTRSRIIMGPRHAYLMAHDLLPHGKSLLLSNNQAFFQVFLDEIASPA
jgi:hypothetical protein